LFCKEESLHKLSPRVAMVRHFADDLNDDAAICRGLRVYRVDENFAVLETEGGDFVVDFLLAEARLDFLTLCAMNEGRGFGVEAMQTIGMFIDKGVILRNELPSNLRRNDILMNCRCSRHYEGMMQ
jgi:hypothetical protein